jgi:Zn-dependent protease
MRKEFRFRLFGTGVFVQVRPAVLMAVLHGVSLAVTAFWTALLLDVPVTGALLVTAAACGLLGGPASVLLHEFAHARAAWRFDIATTIFIQYGIQTLPAFPQQSRMSPGALMVFASAGPLSTGFVAVACAIFASSAHSENARVIGWAAAVMTAVVCAWSVWVLDGRTFWAAAKRLRRKRT